MEQDGNLVAENVVTKYHFRKILFLKKKKSAVFPLVPSS